MKKTGREFENEISKFLLKINKTEHGFFIKSPTPMKMIRNSQEKIVPIYSNKALCDFVGIYNNKFVLIEVKYINGKRFEFNRLKEHQEKQLSAIKRFGGVSLIIFGLSTEEKIIVLEIENYLIFKFQSNKKSINIKQLLEYGNILNLNEIENFINNCTI